MRRRRGPACLEASRFLEEDVIGLLNAARNAEMNVVEALNAYSLQTRSNDKVVRTIAGVEETVFGEVPDGAS